MTPKELIWMGFKNRKTDIALNSFWMCSMRDALQNGSAPRPPNTSCNSNSDSRIVEKRRIRSICF